MIDAWCRTRDCKQAEPPPKQRLRVDAWTTCRHHGLTRQTQERRSKFEGFQFSVQHSSITFSQTAPFSSAPALCIAPPTAIEVAPPFTRASPSWLTKAKQQIITMKPPTDLNISSRAISSILHPADLRRAMDSLMHHLNSLINPRNRSTTCSLQLTDRTSSRLKMASRASRRHSRFKSLSSTIYGLGYW